MKKNKLKLDIDKMAHDYYLARIKRREQNFLNFLNIFENAPDDEEIDIMDIEQHDYMKIDFNSSLCFGINEKEKFKLNQIEKKMRALQSIPKVKGGFKASVKAFASRSKQHRTCKPHANLQYQHNERNALSVVASKILSSSNVPVCDLFFSGTKSRKKYKSKESFQSPDNHPLYPQSIFKPKELTEIKARSSKQRVGNPIEELLTRSCLGNLVDCEFIRNISPHSKTLPLRFDTSNSLGDKNEIMSPTYKNDAFVLKRHRKLSNELDCVKFDKLESPACGKRCVELLSKSECVKFAQLSSSYDNSCSISSNKRTDLKSAKLHVHRKFTKLAAIYKKKEKCERGVRIKGPKQIRSKRLSVMGKENISTLLSDFSLDRQLTILHSSKDVNKSIGIEIVTLSSDASIIDDDNMPTEKMIDNRSFQVLEKKMISDKWRHDINCSMISDSECSRKRGRSFSSVSPKIIIPHNRSKNVCQIRVSPTNLQPNDSISNAKGVQKRENRTFQVLEKEIISDKFHHDMNCSMKSDSECFRKLETSFSFVSPKIIVPLNKKNMCQIRVSPTSLQQRPNDSISHAKCASPINSCLEESVQGSSSKRHTSYLSHKNQSSYIVPICDLTSNSRGAYSKKEIYPESPSCRKSLFNTDIAISPISGISTLSKTSRNRVLDVSESEGILSREKMLKMDSFSTAANSNSFCSSTASCMQGNTTSSPKISTITKRQSVLPKKVQFLDSINEKENDSSPELAIVHYKSEVGTPMCMYSPNENKKRRGQSDNNSHVNTPKRIKICDNSIIMNSTVAIDDLCL